MRRHRLITVISILILASIACSLSGNTPTPSPTQVAPKAIPTAVKQPEPTVPPTPSGQVSSVEEVKKATVQIEAQGSFVDPQLGQMFNVAGRGTGFIIDPSGIVVTNNHVVTGAALVKVWVGGDTKPLNARILGVSECWDLAVIDIEGDGFPYLALHDSAIEAGLEVWAAGFPLGDPEFTLTRGIVSKANADGETSWASVDAVVEHDARIRPGNSGGPLVDKEGKVVGVNYAGNNEYDMNFAIRLKDAMKVVDSLRGGSDFESIGINGQAVMSEDGSLSGVWVSSVKSGSPASKAGIKGGDILTRMEGLVLATDGTLSDYCDILRTRSPQDTVAIEVLRFDTQEVLAGELNGKELETSFSFANELGGEVSQGGEAYSDYITVQDDAGSIQVSIPSAWVEVDGSAWVSDGDVIGASITAAADIEAFNNTYSEPGVFFGVSDDLAQLGGYAQVLDLYRDVFRADCKLEGRYDYVDSAYEGKYDLFTNCGGAQNTFVVLSARPQENKTAFLVTLFINMMTDADLEVLDMILRTFDVVGGLP